jgi:hypothetical protein
MEKEENMQNISTKELNYINDFLSWELLCAKKCFQYGCQENNSGHQHIFFDAVHVHQQNYGRLLAYIDQININKGGHMH